MHLFSYPYSSLSRLIYHIIIFFIDYSGCLFTQHLLHIRLPRERDVLRMSGYISNFPLNKL